MICVWYLFKIKKNFLKYKQCRLYKNNLAFRGPSEDVWAPVLSCSVPGQVYDWHVQSPRHRLPAVCQRRQGVDWYPDQKSDWPTARWQGETFSYWSISGRRWDFSKSKKRDTVLYWVRVMVFKRTGWSWLFCNHLNP